MSTDDQSNNNDGESYADLVDSLQDVTSDNSDAEANETSISDNNGGRIELNEDGSSDDYIRK